MDLTIRNRQDAGSKRVAYQNRAIKHGLSGGRLPKGCGYVVRLTLYLSRSLEQAVLDRGGELGVWELACINSAVRWERHAMLCQRWLRLESEKMDLGTRLVYSREVARGGVERDKAIQRLGLDRSASDNIFDAILATHSGLDGQGSTATTIEGRDAPGAASEPSANGNGSDTIEAESTAAGQTETEGAT